MSFRKFFFSAASMGVLLLPGITVSASAYSLSDRYTLHQSDSTEDACTYYDECSGSEESYLDAPLYVSQYEGSDSYPDDGTYDDGTYDDGTYDDGTYDDGTYDDGTYDSVHQSINAF